MHVFPLGFEKRGRDAAPDGLLGKKLGPPGGADTQ